MNPNLIVDIGLIIIVATIGAYIAKLLRQPLIPVYIIMGVILGPVLGVIKDAETMVLLSEIGIAFLLFIVGLELDLRKLRDVGDVATIGGVVQALLMFGIGYGAAILLGYDWLPALYLGIVMSFSSTMVVIQMLSDKRELDTLHGRIIIGVLLLQDILAILALSMLDTLGTGSAMNIVLNLVAGVVVIIATFLVGKWAFPPLFRSAAKNLQLLFLMAVSTCFFFALLFAQLGFSIAIGAFLAGVVLGNLPYNIEIISRVRPLKDFFSVLFFTAIGLQVSLVSIYPLLLPFLVFTFLTIVISPLLMIIICSLFGYKKRTSFLTGLNLSQVSEFALIVVSAGLVAGHINAELFSLVLLLTIATIAASAYLIKFENFFYRRFGRFLGFFERFSKVNRHLENMSEESRHDTILVGLDRTGFNIYQALKRMKKDFVVVDFDPDVVRHLLEENVPCIYGDIGDPEVQEKLRLEQVKLVISTVPNHQENVILLKRLKEEQSHANVIVTSYNSEDALELYDAGADYVIIPHFLGGQHVSLMLEDISTNLDKLITTKLEHIKALRDHEAHRRRRKKSGR